MASEILLATRSSTAGLWADELQKHYPDVQIWPDRVTDLNAVKFAVVLKQPPGLLEKCPNLMAVNGLGHGIDYIQDEASKLGPDVKILRVVDECMAERMAYWNFWAILNCQRRCDEYFQAQRAHQWKHGKIEEYSCIDNADFRVGIMGFGALGSELGNVLLKNNYPVSAWARSEHAHPGITFFSGKESLPAFLRDVRVLVCLLPLTPETEGLIDSSVLGMLPRGAYFINAGRGKSHDEKAIVDALYSGQLAGAILDVFEEEPLPEASPLWDHPKVRVFPHISSWTPISAAIQQAVDNWAAIKAGGQPLQQRLVKRDLGY